MAGVLFSAQTGVVSLAADTAKTVLQIAAASNHRAEISEFSVSFNGIVNTDEPCLVEVVRQSTAGTMSSLTPKKLNPADDETLQTSASHSANVEPTTGDVVFAEHVHPQGGVCWQATYRMHITVPGNGRLGIRVTAPDAVDCTARFLGSE